MATKRILMILDNEIQRDARVRNEAKALSANGLDVHILCYNEGDMPLYEEHEFGFTIHRFDLSKAKRNKWFGLDATLPLFTNKWSEEIVRATKKLDPDVFHVHDLYMMPAALHANQKFKKEITLDLHENFPATIMTYGWVRFPKSIIARPKRWQKMEGDLLRGADNIVVLSKVYQEKLIQDYPDLASKRFTVYSNVPDVEVLESYPIRPEVLPRKPEDFVLFYFGVIGKRRGVFTAIKAMKQLKEAIPNIRLVLVGPVDKADQPAFNRAINDNAIKDHITWFDWMDISDLPSLITQSDVCISPIVKNPQHESGVANKIFQYMLFSKPLLVSNCTPQMEIVDNNKCGVWHKSEDINDFVRATKELHQNPDLKRLGESGRNAVLKTFNLNQFGQQLSKLYL